MTTVLIPPSADPATARLLQQMKDAGVPPMSDLGPEGARQAMLDGRVNDMVPAAIGRVKDRTFAGPAGEVPIRIYEPEGVTGTTGALLYFHGGGFVIGNLDTHEGVCRGLCAGAGVRVVSVDYRLAPEHPFPAAVDDALAGFDWLHASAPEMNIDPDRLAVGGDSAGGTLAAVVAHHARDNGIGLRAQLLNYPVVDLSMRYPSHDEHAHTPPLHGTVLDWFWTLYLGDDWQSDTQRLRDPRISPLHVANVEGLAPAFIIVAGLDPLRDEATAYAERLSAAGVETLYQCAKGTMHGFMRLGKHIPAARDALNSAAGFLRYRMGANDV